MAAHDTDRGQPLTTGWKFAIIGALIIALANSGIDALRRREEQRYQNHEQRIDELENQLRALQAGAGRALDKSE